ncbi:type II toxin-antitoxin system RelE/ParE family toxin [Streptococcus suis]|nr:type II toxin-antitoxin system RelE/ParE family toxin [Streptococcus suis]
MAYKLVLSDVALKQLKKMDKHVGMMLAKDLKKRLDGLENPRQFGKALVGDYKGLWQYRVGIYRVICDVMDNKIVVLALGIGHRKDIYRK